MRCATALILAVAAGFCAAGGEGVGVVVDALHVPRCYGGAHRPITVRVPGPGRLSWRATIANAAVLHGTVRTTGTRARVDVVAPVVKRRARMHIRFEFTHDGGMPGGSAAAAIDVFPAYDPANLKRLCAAARLGICRRRDGHPKFFDEHGCRYVDASTPHGLEAFEGDVIIASGTWWYAATQNMRGLLARHLARGVRFVVLTGSLTFKRIEMDYVRTVYAQPDLTVVDPRPGHENWSLLDGWRPTFPRGLPAKPTKFDSPLIAAAGTSPAFVEAYPLEGGGVFMFSHGYGLTRNDPAITLLVEHALVWALLFDLPDAPAVVHRLKRGAARDFVEDRGIAGSDKPPPLRSDVVVTSPDAYDDAQLDFLANGGTVLMLVPGEPDAAADVIEEDAATRGLTPESVAGLVNADALDDEAWTGVDLRLGRRIAPVRRALVAGLLDAVTVRKGTAYLVRTGPADTWPSGAWEEFLVRVLANVGATAQEERADRADDADREEHAEREVRDVDWGELMRAGADAVQRAAAPPARKPPPAPRPSGVQKTRPTVAVVPPTPGSAADDVATMLEYLLSHDASVAVVDRTKVQAVLSEMELGLAGLTDNAARAGVGALAQAEYIVSLGAVRGRMSYRIVETATARVVAEGAARPNDDAGLVARGIYEAIVEKVRGVPRFASRTTVGIGAFTSAAGTPRGEALCERLTALVRSHLRDEPWAVVLERQYPAHLLAELELSRAALVETGATSAPVADVALFGKVIEGEGEGEGDEGLPMEIAVTLVRGRPGAGPIEVRIGATPDDLDAASRAIVAHVRRLRAAVVEGAGQMASPYQQTGEIMRLWALAIYMMPNSVKGNVRPHWSEGRSIYISTDRARAEVRVAVRCLENVLIVDETHERARMLLGRCVIALHWLAARRGPRGPAREFARSQCARGAELAYAAMKRKPNVWMAVSCAKVMERMRTLGSRQHERRLTDLLMDHYDLLPSVVRKASSIIRARERRLTRPDAAAAEARE